MINQILNVYAASLRCTIELSKQLPPPPPLFFKSFLYILVYKESLFASKVRAS